MILTIIYLIFSFILESFMSNIFTSTFSSISVFSTIYTIIALVIVYPFFYNDKKYYTRINKFNDYLKNLTNKYEEVFNIDIKKEYDIENSDYLIKLDNSNNYVILNTLTNIYNFEVTNNNYVSKTQNKIAKIENNKIICIETSNLSNLNSFLFPGVSLLIFISLSVSSSIFGLL